ncbi:hypothetical protein GCM10022255_090220 [Dactylosporangium darangshiense]|uniref:Uncharacterized protein n=1 Tax=Dactylosporangium darangshiense TaxID=579108 RepID=A0ABP8DPD0_9ACTN
MCRSRSVDAISYGCIARSCNNPSTASARVFVTFRRTAESPISNNRVRLYGGGHILATSGQLTVTVLNA